ncbi:MAG: hypothetical protein IBX66_07230 [Lutibacter sp.]|nr:hypothetical protein [Lutibacter sp.]
MKKQFLNLGKALNRAEQKQINGGLNFLEFAEAGGVSCKCIRSGGTAIGSTASCEECDRICTEMNYNTWMCVG